MSGEPLVTYFTIQGRVSGKGRVRARIIKPKFGKEFANLYTPSKTRKMEASIAKQAALSMRGRRPFEGPVILTISVFEKPPPSWSKKKREAAVFLTSRFDVDNVAKTLADAMNKIVYKDDRQIADLHITRRYDRIGEERVIVAVTAAI